MRGRDALSALALGAIGAGAFLTGTGLMSVALSVGTDGAPRRPPAVLEPPQACLRVPHADEGSLSVAAGHTLDYDGPSDAWSVDGIVVGHSVTEDDEFVACGPLDVIDLIEIDPENAWVRVLRTDR